MPSLNERFPAHRAALSVPEQEFLAGILRNCPDGKIRIQRIECILLPDEEIVAYDVMDPDSVIFELRKKGSSPT